MDAEQARLLFIIIHLFGVAVGAGGAFASDGAFLTSLADKKISKDEFRILKTASRMVWVGLVCLLISGAGLFALDHEALSESSKFLTKMSIVGVILVNGLVFHIMHLPFIESNLGKPLSAKHTPEGFSEIPFVLISGVISMTSWATALLLGALRGIPLSYFGALGLYVFLIAGGIISILYIFKGHLTEHNELKIKQAAGIAILLAVMLFVIAFFTTGVY